MYPNDHHLNSIGAAIERSRLQQNPTVFANPVSPALARVAMETVDACSTI